MPGDSLLPLSVSPHTAFQYLGAVEALAKDLWNAQARFCTMEEKDEAVAAYLARVSRPSGTWIHPQRGSNTMSGLVFIRPEWAHKLPRSWRSMLAWKRNFITGEGGPEVDEMIWCLMKEMRQSGENECADALMLAHDCYLRAGELTMLRASDVVTDGHDFIVRLGVRERNEKTKTGAHQGVRIDWPGTEAMLKARLAKRAPQDKLFTMTDAGYKKAWLAAGVALRKRMGEPALHIGPPHSVRHAGAARDSASGYRSVWQIQRRGRWQSERSVMRYAKTWAWTDAKARTPQTILYAGSKLLAARGVRQPTAKE